MTLRISVIVCAHNEQAHIGGCLHSLRAQTRPPDEVLVIDNASTDATASIAAAIPGVRVVEEPRKGLVIARETGRREARGNLLVYVDADCRAPLVWSRTSRATSSAISRSLRSRDRTGITTGTASGAP
jgi:glycosyltransferase involved in cell wall biosynthesis